MKLYSGLCIGGPLNGHMASGDLREFNIPAGQVVEMVSKQLGQQVIAVAAITYKFFPGINVLKNGYIQSYDFWIPTDSEIEIQDILILLRETYAKANVIKVGEEA